MALAGFREKSGEEVGKENKGRNGKGKRERRRKGSCFKGSRG